MPRASANAHAWLTDGWEGRVEGEVEVDERHQAAGDVGDVPPATAKRNQDPTSALGLTYEHAHRCIAFPALTAPHTAPATTRTCGTPAPCMERECGIDIAHLRQGQSIDPKVHAHARK